MPKRQPQISKCQPGRNYIGVFIPGNDIKVLKQGEHAISSIQLQKLELHLLIILVEVGASGNFLQMRIGLKQ